ncbi:MAG: S49 family peptidase, partial [Desulfovibrio sp.]|nr:S49 family peptidase [Desulfovibrio sp.]
MFFDLPHVASRVYGTPLLIVRPKLDVILSVLAPRLQGEPLAATGNPPAPHSGLRITEAGIAVVPVTGTLVRRASGLNAQSGLCSYHDIQNMAEDAFTNPEVKAVLLEIDSCGGEAGGVFDLADSLRGMADVTGKPLWAVADEAALSAAYAIACAADRIVVPRTGEVGSIGVVALHVDESGADVQAGLAFTYIYAGAHKVDANPHTPLTEDAHDRLQADVNALYADFVSLAARRRNLDEAGVRGTGARVFRGREAVAAGLADQIGNFQQAHAQIALLVQNSQQPATIRGNRMNEQETMVMADQTVIEKQVETKICERMTELAAIASQAKRLGLEIDPVDALKNGVSPDALRERVLKEAAERDTQDVQSF